LRSFHSFWQLAYTSWVIQLMETGLKEPILGDNILLSKYLAEKINASK
jgi:hypothetical protein